MKAQRHHACLIRPDARTQVLQAAFPTNYPTPATDLRQIQRYDALILVLRKYLQVRSHKVLYHHALQPFQLNALIHHAKVVQESLAQHKYDLLELLKVNQDSVLDLRS